MARAKVKVKRDHTANGTVVAGPAVEATKAVATPATEHAADVAFAHHVTRTAETMLHGCSKVRTRFSWLSASAKIDDDVLSDMMGETAAKTVKDAISASKRLMKSKNPAFVAAKDAFAAVGSYVNSMTIPLIALSQQAKAEGDDFRKDGGVRVIQKKDMAEFDARMQYLIGVLTTAVERLQDAMPSIIEEDRERLNKLNAKLFKADDYPEDVTRCISVEYTFEPIGVDADWKQLCPEIYKREGANAKRKFEAVVENAAVEFASRFVAYVKQVVDQLGNRQRLNPKPGKDMMEITVKAKDSKAEKKVMASLKEAEICLELGHEDDPKIPEHHVVLEVRLHKGGAKGESTVGRTGPIRRNAMFDDLRPYETREKKKLYGSTIDNLKHELEAFLNIGSMLGPYEGVVESGVEQVRELLRKGNSGMDTEVIANRLREGSSLREEMRDALQKIGAKVLSAVGEAKQRRRLITKKMMAGAEDD